MNISILLPDLRGGGVERIRLVLAREFTKRGCTVEFLLQNAHGELLPEAMGSFRVVDFKASRARDLPFRLARYLKQEKPDALLAAMWPLTAIAPFAALISGFRGKVVVSEHAMLSREYKDWGKLTNLALRGSTMLSYRLASACVGVSRGVADDMSALSNLALENFIAIHNPVRPLGLPTAEDIAKAESVWRTNGPRILTVGTLKSVKNHSLQLRSFARINNPNARLVLLGQGQEEPMLRQLASELGIADRIIFAGFHSDPTPFYATADLFVLSSDHEGFGNVIVEALSFGLPVVSTDCPSGPREILENGRWGRLVPVGDSDALLLAINETLSSAVDRESLKMRAASFSSEVAARNYLTLLGIS